VPPSAEALSKLLSTLYAAPTQPELWNRFLEELIELLGSPAAAILHQDLGREHHGFSAAVGIDPEAQSSYEKHVGEPDSGPPPPETLAALELIVPHVRIALKWRHQSCAAEMLSRNQFAVIDALRAGVVIVNLHGDCLIVNRRAHQLCAADDGIDIRQSRLCAHHPEDHHSLCALIERATDLAMGRAVKSSGTVSVRRRLTSSLQVSAVPLVPRSPLAPLTVAHVATAAVFIRALDDEAMCLPELLMTGYGLTSAEARLAAHLFAGASLSQAAQRNHVSRETVRVQLRSIFGKTHVRRQTDLLRLCWQLVGTL
jgi:DNA-binding CsgD family transcriptional regulator